MYVFTLFGYYYLYRNYQPNFCESTWICLLTAIDKSFKTDGKIFVNKKIDFHLKGSLGAFLEVTGMYWTSTGYFIVRFFFDNIF